MAYMQLDRGAAATVRAGDNMSKSSSARFHAALAAWTSARFSSDLLRRNFRRAISCNLDSSRHLVSAAAIKSGSMTGPSISCSKLGGNAGEQSPRHAYNNAASARAGARRVAYSYNDKCCAARYESRRAILPKRYWAGVHASALFWLQLSKLLRKATVGR